MTELQIRREVNKLIKSIKKLNKQTFVFILLMIPFSIIIPMVTNNYSMGVMNLVMLHFIAALGVTMMLGMGGQVTFATVAFLGAGSYTTAILSKNFGIPSVLSVILAVLFCMIAAFIIGKVLFRLNGTYFTFATIGFAQIMNNVYLNWKPVTGGPDGITGIPKLNLLFFTPTKPIHWFYVLVVLSAICLMLVEHVRQTSLGRSLGAVRDNEIAAHSLGVDVYNTKVNAFVIAGALAGFAGALLAHHNSAISAYLYTYDLTVNYIVIVMLGGINSTIGTFIGSLLVTMLPEWLRPLQTYMRLIYGVFVIRLMIFMPMGLAGMWDILHTKIKNMFRKSKGKAVEQNA